MNLEIENYLQSKGWEFKFVKGDFILSDCPLNRCGPNHFYISADKEIFHCFKCDERGTFLNLKYRLGDIPKIVNASNYFGSKLPKKTIDLSIIEKYHQELLGNIPALSYLEDQRGFTLDTIKKFKLGFHDGCIIIPYSKMDFV